jgi:hypothetical protein
MISIRLSRGGQEQLRQRLQDIEAILGAIDDDTFPKRKAKNGRRSLLPPIKWMSLSLNSSPNMLGLMRTRRLLATSVIKSSKPPFF